MLLKKMNKLQNFNMGFNIPDDITHLPPSWSDDETSFKVVKNPGASL